MRLETLEKLQRWRATVEYHGTDGQQTLCLMEDGLVDGAYYWFIADYQGGLPWEAVRCYDPSSTVRMMEEGTMRLVKGQWPERVSPILAQSLRPLACS
jgi:hypothetical protein